MDRPLQCAWGMQRRANVLSRSTTTAAIVFSLVTAWSGVVAAEGPEEARGRSAGRDGMIVGGFTAIGLALPPLATGAVLYGDTGGFISGRAFSPYFLVPGAVSATAGVVLMTVGLARSNDSDEVSSRGMQVVVAPQQVGLSGHF
ncbi:MAG: hypothetical protein WKG00_08510 [Polyangiaceae bacterium]